MNAEQILDALNELDEDLVAQTDQVRQGTRVIYRPPVRRIIAAAACAVLIFASAWCIPRMRSDSAESIHDMEPGQDEYGVNGQVELSQAGGTWEAVTVDAVTVFIPPDWEWARLDTNEEWGSHIALSHGENHFIIGYYPSFGVCGTGLVQETHIIAGMEARMGTYDGKSMWDFIVFPDDYVAINESGESWMEEERDTILSILETLIIDKEDGK